MRIGKKGFTLVEVIVSLAIMTIVAGSVGAFIMQATIPTCGGIRS